MPSFNNTKKVIAKTIKEIADIPDLLDNLDICEWFSTSVQGKKFQRHVSDRALQGLADDLYGYRARICMICLQR
jgi:hypothetical protein